jgi:uncharacterized membrane protein YkvA (DUF1232 family)
VRQPAQGRSVERDPDRGAAAVTARRPRLTAAAVADYAVLFKRLLQDRRVPKRVKVALALVVPYLASPVDLIPDFIPVLGQLDDAVVVIAVLRYVRKKVDPALLEELQPRRNRLGRGRERLLDDT